MSAIRLFFIMFATLLPFIVGAPIGDDLVSYENVRTENGYRFSYETKDGQAREEVGTIDPDTGVLTVTGWYSYQTPDGATHRVDYISDEEGYRIVEPVVVEAQVVTQGINNAVLLSLVG